MSKHTKRMSVRVPDNLSEDIEAIAARDANHVAATIRRLLSIAVEFEHRARGNDGRR